MTNRDLEAAWNYHNRTKHSYWSVRTDPHFLDWANQPLPFKIYPTLEPLPLPRDGPPTGVPALVAISQLGLPAEREAVPDLKSLAQILYFSAGITKRRTYPGGEIFFRAASCTGALYEIELYLVCGDLPDLEAGVYHFNPADFALRRLRAGDYRGVLVEATAGEPATAHAPATIISTATYWRNAWKYRARTYRHFGWDNGTMLANLLALCAALKVPARLLCAFVDDPVNRLLDLDTQREVAFSLVPVGYVSAVPPAPPPEMASLGLETVPVSRKEVDYPLMREMHEASCLRSQEEVAAWRGHSPQRELPAPTGRMVSLEPSSEEEMSGKPLERVILRRGSTRQFAQESISLAQFSTLLDGSTRGIPADFLDRPGTLLNDLYLTVHAVEGLTPGAYLFHRQRRALECLKEGNFRSEAYHLGLEQELPGDASAAMFYLADLPAILDRFGNRGYRAVQLEAGILGGELYLAAYAQGLGATGLTFYDDDVVQFFSPHAQGKSAIFLMAVGQSARRRRS
ncbi:MAG: SagB/ThcOx family dehydrogenase [Acidobacteria bacterium]|nr:SagB/ThcOx family dehydrogenase [Acidobacteriota bacterium]